MTIHVTTCEHSVDRRFQDCRICDRELQKAENFEIAELLREIRNKLDCIEGYAAAWYQGQR